VLKVRRTGTGSDQARSPPGASCSTRYGPTSPPAQGVVLSRSNIPQAFSMYSSAPMQRRVMSFTRGVLWSATVNASVASPTLLTVDFGTPSYKFTVNICTYLIF
jgi:hypothetical protein